MSTTPEAVEAAPKNNRKRNLIIGAVGAFVVISLIASCGGEPADVNAAPSTTTEAPAPAETSTTPAPVIEEATATMPDLSGMTADEAGSALADLGIAVETDVESDGVYLTFGAVSSTDPAAGETVTEGDTVTLNFESTLSLEEENALEEALSYLDSMAFSKAGLLDQMTSEYGSDYPKDVAKWAIKALEKADLVDWNEEAAEAAQQYLDSMSFSKNELRDQLTSEYGSQFTKEQAAYALKAVGY